jgi:hypothetical protein
MDIRRMKHLTQVRDFSPSVDSGATVDHYNDIKLYFLVMNLIIKSNELSKSGFGVEIGHFCLEIESIFSTQTRFSGPNYIKELN